MQTHHTTDTPVFQTYTFAQKWGDDPFTLLGHTQVPDALIGYAARLGLKPEECWLIVCVLKFKHTPDNPFPSQARLAQIVGQSEDTIRRLLKRIERRGLMRVERVRGDLGHYTHSVYDFTPLRAALNAAFYQDHPEQRPPESAPVQATVQKCTVAPTTPQKGPQPPRKTGRNYPAKSGLTTPQDCGPNKSLKEDIEIESEALNVATSNVSRPVQKTSLRTPEHVRLANRVVALTGDEKSRRRYEQLAGIVDRAGSGARELWEAAYKATEARLTKSSERLEAPGAYFCAVLTRLLMDAEVYVPVGTPEERADIKAQIRKSLAQADAAQEAGQEAGR